MDTEMDLWAWQGTNGALNGILVHTHSPVFLIKRELRISLLQIKVNPSD